jgi:hypothetical protein
MKLTPHRRRRESASRGRRSDAQKREAVLVFLKHPNLCQLSDREISRRTRVSQPFVSKLRKAVISKTGLIAGQSLITRTGRPDQDRDEAVFDRSEINSFAWAMADAPDRRRFVDGVGLRELYDAGSPDHRDAFVARLLADLPQNKRPESLPSNVVMYLERLERHSSLEHGRDDRFLRRDQFKDTEEPATENNEKPAP